MEARCGARQQPRRILSIVSGTTELTAFSVGFFAEEMTRAFLMFTEARQRLDLASLKGGEVMFDAHSKPCTPGEAYAGNLISLGLSITRRSKHAEGYASHCCGDVPDWT